MKKKILSMALIIVMTLSIFTIVPMSASAKIVGANFYALGTAKYSGVYGGNINYSFNSKYTHCFTPSTYSTLNSFVNVFLSFYIL